MKINGNYLKLAQSYLFSTIDQKVSAYLKENPGAKIIRMGIGDVTQPLCPAVVSAMHSAVDEMGTRGTFRGYGPEQGYDFLREAISGYYKSRGVSVGPGEVYVGDGAKSDLANILDIFSLDNSVLVADPVYPVYVDTNVMAGRKIYYATANDENGFLPMPDEKIPADLIYICSPNNPTGAVYSKEQLAEWVRFAKARDAVILFDAAYEAYIGDPALPRSIYEIEGAAECAIEFCSFSKSAGFTGTRCGWTVLPDALVREGVKLGRFWVRRQTTKFNGVNYVVQKGAAAVLSEEGQRQTKEQVAYYKENAAILGRALSDAGISYCGGLHSPYVWLGCPGGMPSWDFFDRLLEKFQIVGTPGAGFGTAGEGHFRLTGFGSRENTLAAVERLKGLHEIF